MRHSKLIQQTVDQTKAQIQKQFKQSYFKHELNNYQDRIKCFNHIIRQQTLSVDLKANKKPLKSLINISQINIERVKPQKILKYYECINRINLNIDTNFQILLNKFYKAKNKLKQDFDLCYANQLNTIVQAKEKQCQRKCKQEFKQKMKRIYTKYYANDLITSQK